MTINAEKHFATICTFIFVFQFTTSFVFEINKTTFYYLSKCEFIFFGQKSALSQVYIFPPDGNMKLEKLSRKNLKE